MMKLLYLLILSLFKLSTATSDYVKYTEECTVQKTQKEGIHKFLKDCPSVVQDLVLGEQFPRICDEGTLCKDVVCCPDVKPINEYQVDVLSELRKQIFLSPCNITGKSGIFKPKENCDKNQRIEDDKQICKFDFCGEYVCCKETVLETTFEVSKGKFELPDEWRVCSNHNNPLSNDGVVGEECVVEATGQTGVCRDEGQCPFYKQPNQLGNKANRTICGYESCLDIICCPQIDFETTDKGEHCEYCISITKGYH